MEIQAAADSWSTGRKIVFRFLCLYTVVYILPFPLGSVFFTDALNFSAVPWDALIAWTGRHVFNLDRDLLRDFSGSGDTTWHYVSLFLMTVLSLAGTLVWSVLDRQRRNYDKLLYWLIVLVRYYLGVVLVTYGLYKILKTQFPFPDPLRLMKPYGDSSPAELLWTFMGYSTAYNFFTGFCEALGGFLLFFRRTKMLGALISIAVMGNVVMLNFTYNVAVKLFSTHLLALSLIVLIPDVRRLIDFFVLNKPAAAAPVVQLFQGRWKIPHAVGKWVFILYVISIQVVFNMKALYGEYGDKAPKPPLYGIYDVELFVLNRDTLPPLLTDTRRWRRMTLSRKNWADISYMDEVRIAWRIVPDTIHHRFELALDSVNRYDFQYEREGDLFFIHGKMQSDSINVRMRKRDFMLQRIEFSWISEYYE